jgi:uncharacterized membrane protein
VGSAVCYAAAAVVQQRLAASLPTTAASLTTLRQRQWWIAVALNGVGASLHMVALRYGPLTVVQPLGTLTLVLALPLGAALMGRRVTRREGRGAAATVIGLGGLLVLTASAAPVNALTTDEVLLVGAVTAATLVGLVAATSRTSRPGVRALLYATASGIASGVASGLTQTIVVHMSRQGLSAVADPAVVLVLGLATAGLLLSQAAYRGYGLGAPLAMSTLANPLAAAAIGLVLLGEGHVAGPAGAGFAVAAAVVAGCGVALLARAVPVGDHQHPRTAEPANRPIAQPVLVARSPRASLPFARALFPLSWASLDSRSAGGEAAAALVPEAPAAPAPRLPAQTVRARDRARWSRVCARARRLAVDSTAASGLTIVNLMMVDLTAADLMADDRTVEELAAVRDGAPGPEVRNPAQPVRADQA